jgi:hypothetical protein
VTLLLRCAATELRRACDGVSRHAWVVTVRSCCVLVSGGHLASSPFSWCGWCRFGECDARGIADSVRVLTRRVSCRHCACVAVVCDAGRCSGGSSDTSSRCGEWSLRSARRCLACVVTCGVVGVVLLSQTPHAATTAPTTTAPGTAAATVCASVVAAVVVAADSDAACDVSFCAVASYSSLCSRRHQPWQALANR